MFRAILIVPPQKTPHFSAACAMGHLDCVIAMLKNGINKADYNALNNFAQTPLDLALKHRQEEVVHRLRYLEAETGQVAIERILRLQKTKKQERVRNGVSSEEEQSGWLETFYDWTY
jgi:ankyrin repeat protein